MNLLLAINIPCWLIPILVGLICAILGYLLGRLLGGSNKVEVDEDVYKNRISKLEADLEACKSSKSSFDTDKSKLEADLEACKSNSRRLELDLINAKNAANKAPDTSSGIASSFAAAAAAAPTGATFDSDAAKAVFGKKIKEDDLTVVEGIGPKIKELFHNHDIKTWAALGNTSVEKCQEVLNSGGKRFDIHKPGTWPEQAKLASEGKWQKLKDWQDSLDGGK